jgi:alpha-tubulin suppressor-like RCC1 family protein
MRIESRLVTVGALCAAVFGCGPERDNGALIVAPDDPAGSNALSSSSTVIATRNEPAGRNCQAGGIAVLSGPDRNKNGLLDPSECATTLYICNGVMGANGANGKSSLIAVTDQPVSTACPTAGKKLSVGLDANANGALDDAEVTNVSYVCNGRDGANGKDGTSGSSTLVAILPQAVGDPNCPPGGQGIYGGPDVNGDGLLQPGEVKTSAFVCNGANGASGANALIKELPETAGSNCPFGGRRIDAGTDLSGNGVLETAELTSTSYACNGAPGPEGRAGGGGGGGGVAAVSAGISHTCALKKDGSAWCWGYNMQGQLGRATSSTYSAAPILAAGLSSGVSAIATGFNHTCALKTDGSVRCWGYGRYGQLGNGASADSIEPTTPSGLGSGVAAIAAGGYQSCALKTDGSVVCWGDIFFSSQSDNALPPTFLPVAMTEIGNDVTTLSVGGFHACFLKKDGSTWCWGANTYGQLGDDSKTNSRSPVAVSGLTSGVAAISAGPNHTCAIKRDGSTWCWGLNQLGQVGSTSLIQTVPSAVAGLDSGAVALCEGGNHTCAVKADSIWCWGFNGRGELGNGSTGAQALPPAAVAGMGGGVVGITAGSEHTCAVKNDGAVWCWGDNFTGQLGNDWTESSPLPVAVASSF